MSITIKDVKSCRGDWVFNDAWVTGLISDLCDLAEALQRENEALKQEKQDMFREVLRLSREEPESAIRYDNDADESGKRTIDDDFTYGPIYSDD